jgi:hypothetical protein
MWIIFQKGKIVNRIKKMWLKIIAKRKLWSIAVLRVDKESLFELDSLIPKKPTINAKDINDCEASFVADPFLVKEAGKIYCFFEIKDKDKDKGIIGVSSSNDGVNFIYEKIVLEEPFHLSYPSVYKIDGAYYMIPESGANSDVRLYEATNFPYEWRLKKVLLHGENYADATMVYRDDMWYMFVSKNTNDTLKIFYSKTFDGDYIAHAKNQIYIDNKKYARNGGGIIQKDGKLYRFAQDCQNRYGEKLYLIEIINLSPNEFKEEIIKEILSPKLGIGWNTKKMHHLSCVDIDDCYLVAIDGEGYRKR